MVEVEASTGWLCTAALLPLQTESEAEGEVSEKWFERTSE